MSVLNAKKILLGVTGSIAAYKIAILTRLLVRAGAEVQIVMTEAATHFISPLTLSTLSHKPVHISVIEADSWNNHVEMGLWADAMVIAPLSANTMAKMACGHSDNIVAAIYLSARCPVFFAPAMDLDMWAHPATRENLSRLQSYGNQLIPVGHGELASGLKGDGRMAEPEIILERLEQYFLQSSDLKGKKILITAGPTYEAIDPVRFIGNRSSGKMGLALAEECAARGAKVRLVLGPSSLQPVHPGIRTVRVESAQEMYAAALEQFDQMDAAILAAAVADYRPAQVSDQKIKKKAETLRLELERTRDIAAALGKLKKEGQMLIGFALETNDEEANARRKLEKKNLNFIVLNSLNEKGAGFRHDTNKISIILRGEEGKQDPDILHFPLKDKKEVAIDIIDTLVRLSAK